MANTLYNTDNYTYLDISNHNFQVGETHYKTGLYVWIEIQKSGKIRPVNNTKIYGADGGWGWTARSATDTEGGERFWRNIFAGAASARFHRPPGGLGHRTMAMNHIKSMRMLTGSVDIFSFYPSNELLGEREANEAYCLASSDDERLLYFPSRGNIRLNVKPGSYLVQWLNITTSEWKEPLKMSFPGNIEPPGKGTWGVMIRKEI